MVSKAAEIEWKLAAGEALLRRAERARVTALIGVAVGTALIVFRFPLSLEIAIVVIVVSCISLYRTSKGIREIDEGMIQHRGMKAGLSSKDEV